MRKAMVIAVSAFFLAWILTAGPCPSAVAGDAPKPTTASANIERINKALDEPTEVDFIETPLKDVVDAIKTRHGIEIQLDAKRLTEMQVSADTPITRAVKGVSLRSALRLMLHEVDLDFVVRDEVLLITAAEYPATEVRQYDVGDLLSGGGTVEDLVKAARLALPRVQDPTASADRVDAKSSSPDAASPQATVPVPGKVPSLDKKSPSGSELVSVHLAPANGDVTGFRTVLIVRSTREGQARITDMLAELRTQILKSEQR